MRWVWIVAVAIAFAGQLTRAEDLNPDQLRRNYDEATGQLKKAQDRINALATENEQMKAKLADMQKQIDTAKANEATFAERTYQWRATLAAWDRFLDRYPNLKGRWQAFLESDAMTTFSLPQWE